MIFKRSFIFSCVVICLLAAAFGAGYFYRDYRASTFEQFTIFTSAYQILQQHGLKEIANSPALEYGMIHGMVDAYGDPYTLFVEPVQHELESNALHGSFGGIGAGLSLDGRGRWVLFPYPDSPAAKAGILEGDRLIAVGELQAGPDTPVDTLQSAIRGPVGQRVRLTIARPPDYSPTDIQVRRAEIPIPSVTWHLAPDEPRVGVVEINLIAASTTDEIQKAVKDLQDRDAAYFIIDLRSNPGGLLTAGVDIARLFLKEGVVIEQQYRGKEVETFRVDRPGPLSDIPLAVLIDNGSASAAEIIAGSLQAHHRAVLVGVPSFGKDTIQLVFDLADHSSLHVTAAQWWVPGLDHSLSGKGLQPDILVTPSEDPSLSGPDEILNAAISTFLEETN